MLPDRVSNPGPLTYESGALPIALRGPAINFDEKKKHSLVRCHLPPRRRITVVISVYRSFMFSPFRSGHMTWK